MTPRPLAPRVRRRDRRGALADRRSHADPRPGFSNAIVLPPELGQSQPFRIEEISHYDHRGPAWYWNTFAMGEHTGTHFDAPIHWVTGKDLPTARPTRSTSSASSPLRW